MMVRNASNQRGENSVNVVALSTRNPWMLVASKAVFLENYLAVSTWILNGSSIECPLRSISLSVYLVFDLEAG